MSKPLISVVIPTYNRAAFLKQALESVLAQKLTDFEIIVGDNASTDDTAKLMADFHDPRIRYYRHGQNLGATRNWRFVVSQAVADLVAPLADDDLFKPEHLMTGCAALEAYPRAAYYTCASEFFGRPMPTPIYRPQCIVDTTKPLIYFEPARAVDFLGADNPGPMNSMICRRLAIHERIYWGPDGYLPQDLLVMTQLMVQGGFVFGNRPMTRYRIHDTNISITPGGSIDRVRFNLMVWWGIRWLVRFLLEQNVSTLADVEAHGLNAKSVDRLVAPVVFGLGSLESPASWRQVAQRIFLARKEVDLISKRFSLARRFGFWIIPVAEKISQWRCGWHP